MDKKTSGYVAGIGSFFGFALLLTLALNNEWNTSGQILWGFAIIFAGLGVGCFWKPESFGASVSQFFEKFSENKGGSDSHDIQVQNKSSGIQAKADRGGQININISPEKTLEKKETELNNEEISIVNRVVEEKESKKSILLSDGQNITKLNINDNLLDQIYGQAFNQAIQSCHDAKLSTFAVQVFPFRKLEERVTIYYYFYSKSANKILKFRYSEQVPEVEHIVPDKFAKGDLDRSFFENLPWKEATQWADFLVRAYNKIAMLSTVPQSSYHLSAYAFAKPNWRASFEDGFNGNERSFVWNPSKGLSEDSINEN